MMLKSKEREGRNVDVNLIKTQTVNEQLVFFLLCCILLMYPLLISIH